MQQEIDGMDTFINNGLVDSYRLTNSDEVKYTWWSYRGGAREKNVGWRIDYFLISDLFTKNIKDSFILNDIYGSDHCPVGIKI